MKKQLITAVAALVVCTTPALTQQLSLPSALAGPVNLPAPPPPTFGYLLADPNTGEVMSPSGDRDQLNDLNTPELKHSRLAAAYRITHPTPVSAEEMAIQMALPVSILKPGPVVVPAPGSQEEVDTTVQIVVGSQGSASPLTYTDYVAPPNIIWHNSVTSANRSWSVSGTTFNSTPLPPSTDGHSWKMVGTADFDGDGQPDIVWEDPTGDAHKVWFMNGTSIKSIGYFQATGDIRWRVVGVGDFDGDGKGDLLWQHSVYLYPAIWFLNGTVIKTTCALLGTGDINWRVVQAFAKTGSTPIIAWKNQVSGEFALWYLNGCTPTLFPLITDNQGYPLINLDNDFRIVGYWDMNGDQSPDFLFRHTTLGIQGVWYLNGSTFISGTWGIAPEFNLNWRIATQETIDSTWNLDQIPSPGVSSTVSLATVSTSPLEVNLSFWPDPGSLLHCDLQRRSNDLDWQIIQSNLIGWPPVNLVDATVAPGNRYEWRLLSRDYPSIHTRSAFAAIAAAPVFARGRIIILVDQDLRSHSGFAQAAIDGSVHRLTNSLIGDGWTIVGPTEVLPIVKTSFWII
jgi:FG-GAP-like repeat